MRLTAEAGLWSTGPLAAPTPLVAVLEVSGAALSWTVDDPAEWAATRITFTDPRRADWLWRILGESGHVALVSAVEGRSADESQSIELAGVNPLPGSVERLRRLAVGHWLRRWWPASDRAGIPGLGRALLDTELAVLTAAAQDFFTDDTLDSDVWELLGPHAAELIAHVRGGDPRVLQLARAGAEVADGLGMWAAGWSEMADALDDSTAPDFATDELAGRNDYALAAGTQARRPGAAPIAGGVASINWGGVPPAIFDAAENTVDWTVEVAGSGAVAVVQAAVIGPGSATGVGARLRSGSVSGTGALDASGRATLALVDAHGRVMTETTAWNHDWSPTSVTIGADVDESAHTRERIRDFARARLDRPAADAFLAEILAAESNY